MHNLVVQMSNVLIEEGFSTVEISGTSDFSLGFVSDSCLLIFADTPNPSVDEASVWVEAWYESMPKSVNFLLIAAVFESGVPEDFSRYLNRSRKSNFVSRTCTLVALDAVERRMVGRVDTLETNGISAALKVAIASYDPSVIHDPEELAEHKTRLAQKIQTTAQELLRVRPLVSYSLIALCLAIFGIMSLAGGTQDSWTLLRFGANFAPLNKVGQIWRWGSAMFIHIGFLHLAFNLYSLYNVGPLLERVLGNRAFAALYALSGLAGGLASTYFGKGGLSAGASGAIFGLFGAGLWIGRYWKNELPGPLRRRLFSGFGPAIFYNLLIGFSTSFIDNSAHLGGLVAGMATMAAVSHLGAIKLRKTSGPLSWFSACLGILPVLFLGWALLQAARYPSLDSYPTRNVEVSASSYRVNLPIFMQPKSSDGRTSFVGPGFAWIDSGFVTDPGEALPDLKGEAGAAEVLNQMASAGLKAESHQLLTIQARPWLVWKVSYPQDRVGFVALAVDGRRTWMPMMITVKAQEESVKKLFLKCLESMETSASAGKR